jgi:hypothetical protein
MTDTTRQSAPEHPPTRSCWIRPCSKVRLHIFVMYNLYSGINKEKSWHQHQFSYARISIIHEKSQHVNMPLGALAFLLEKSPGRRWQTHLHKCFVIIGYFRHQWGKMLHLQCIIWMSISPIESNIGISVLPWFILVRSNKAIIKLTFSFPKRKDESK